MDKKSFLKNEYKDIIKKIDTYSFGMLIPMMLYNSDLLEDSAKSHMIIEFLNIFAFMIEPYHKNRISIKVAYNLFDKLLNKYTKGTPKKVKSNKNKSKKRKSKKKSKKR